MFWCLLSVEQLGIVTSMFNGLSIICFLLYSIGILHICHNHHNRWLCKNVQSSVKFSNGYVKENVQFYKKCVTLHKFQSV